MDRHGTEVYITRGLLQNDRQQVVLAEQGTQRAFGPAFLRG